MIVYCDADDCKWNEDGKCKGPAQSAGHTVLYYALCETAIEDWLEESGQVDEAEEDNE